MPIAILFYNRGLSTKHRPWDAVGMTLSLLCVLHCMLMPLVIAYLPVLGLQWLARDGFHRWLALLAIGFGAASFVPGYLRHRRVAVPLVGGLGLLVLCLAAAAGQHQCCTNPDCPTATTLQLGTSSPLFLATAQVTSLDVGWTPIGGLLLILAHSLNCHWSHCCRGGICRSLQHQTTRR